MGKAGRKNKYETHVKPYLEKIPKWYLSKTEAQIAKKLGISEASWTNYKKEHPELQECLRSSQADLVDELKSILKKKAQGFYYEEATETEIDDPEKGLITKVEKKKRYAQPDTGAIHLLLKNLDPSWHNDDVQTMEIKRQQTEIMKQKAEAAEW
jgi:hypothetical protein